MGQEKNFN